MRYFSFEADGRPGIGLRASGGVFGLTDDAADYPGSLDELVVRGREALEAAGKTLSAHPLDDGWTLQPLLTAPGKIICVGLNYADHTSESGYSQPDYPTLFPRFASSLIAHDAPVVRPRASATLDFEGEVVAVIGRGGRHIEKARALDYVLGYSVFNDGSVREYQFKSPQWTVGKNFDGTGAFGPELVTADELPAGAKGLRIETRLNGETVQRANTDDMVFDVASLVAIISEAMTLAPGDVIVTGTPAGIGHAREPKLYMKAGDVVEVEVEKIGLLRNPVVDEDAPERAVA